jgi:hypothetical protein
LFPIIQLEPGGIPVATSLSNSVIRTAIAVAGAARTDRQALSSIAVLITRRVATLADVAIDEGVISRRD